MYRTAASRNRRLQPTRSLSGWRDRIDNEASALVGGESLRRWQSLTGHGASVHRSGHNCRSRGSAKTNRSTTTTIARIAGVTWIAGGLASVASAETAAAHAAAAKRYARQSR